MGKMEVRREGCAGGKRKQVWAPRWPRERCVRVSRAWLCGEGCVDLLGRGVSVPAGTPGSGLWVVVGLHGSVWGAVVVAQVPPDPDAEAEICQLGFNWET